MLLQLLFPPKCILCHKLLSQSETDLCHDCRSNAPEIIRVKRKIEFIAQWTAVWYYKDNVRDSIHRYKFKNIRSYAEPYARLLAVKLLETDFIHNAEIITWAPVSAMRLFKRGYDQSQLLAQALGKELNLPVRRLIKKHRHTAPQSRLRDSSARRANIQGAYKVIDVHCTKGKNILLIDDVITTGSTATECARVLLTAGAKSIYLAAIASAHQEKPNKRR